MNPILRTFIIAATCLVALSAPVLADDPPPAPTDPEGDPTDPHGGTMGAPVELVLLDADQTVFFITWLVPWIVR